MAQIKNNVFPVDPRMIDGGPVANRTLMGRPSLWDLIPNSPYKFWQYTASFIKGYFETAPVVTYNDLYRFFLVNEGYGFLLTDPIDNTSTQFGGTGVVLLLNGDYRLFKRYPSGSDAYDHPITRPNGTITLGGGATGGTVDPDTGIVTGISAEGTWSGAFYRPCIFLEGNLPTKTTHEGVITVTVTLQEQLEV